MFLRSSVGLRGEKHLRKFLGCYPPPPPPFFSSNGCHTISSDSIGPTDRPLAGGSRFVLTRCSWKWIIRVRGASLPFANLVSTHPNTAFPPRRRKIYVLMLPMRRPEQLSVTSLVGFDDCAVRTRTLLFLCKTCLTPTETQTRL